MFKNITDFPTLKEIETDLFRVLQETSSVVVQEVLEDLEFQLAESRDKKRYEHKGRRSVTMDTLFGSAEISRVYYRDRETEK